jgi:hypothetical protein
VIPTTLVSYLSKALPWLKHPPELKRDPALNPRKPFSCFLLFASLALGLVPALASAETTAGTDTTGNPIEGVWSFSGGAVAIDGLSDGTFQGTVVNPTKFAVCTHPAGQVMWTGMRQQADGSLWGLHTWFRGGEKCEENPVRGLSAWRVLVATDGTRQLIVCFSTPGDDSQPHIAPDGKCTGGTFGPAIESSPLAPLPGSGGAPVFDKVVVVPGSTACLKRSLKIRLKNPKYDPLKEVVIKIAGKKVKAIVGTEKLKKPIVLKNLPEGSFKLSIVATTVLNERLKGKKKYRTCVTGSGKIRLPGAKIHS